LTDTIHLHPTAPLAARVLLPGDPGRALRLAQELLDGPKMFNHNRGLWGYTGPALLDGELLTIQSTGMGGPSAAIVISELVDLGARRLVRVGTCGALVPSLDFGDLVIGSEAVADDGASHALGAPPGGRVAASPALLAALRGAAVSEAAEVTGVTRVADGAVVSTDLFYAADDREDAWRAAGAIAVEMETATLYALAARRGVQAAALLLVSDVLTGERVRIEPDDLHAGELRLGAVAARALAAVLA
jgi:DeoD family purine-nucleoside phosphorylase